MQLRICLQITKILTAMWIITGDSEVDVQRSRLNCEFSKIKNKFEEKET